MPQEVLVVLYAFAPLFSKPVWNHAKTLAIGSILSRGKRTVTSALRVMGLREEKRFTNFHRVLNRAKWSSLQGARILFGLLVNLLPANLPLIILIDETIERRKGKKSRLKDAIETLYVLRKRK
jgi:DDE superfamily endonuclease